MRPKRAWGLREQILWTPLVRRGLRQGSQSPLLQERRVIPEGNFMYLRFACCDVGGSGAGVWSLRDILPAQNLMKDPLLLAL